MGVASLVAAALVVVVVAEVGLLGGSFRDGGYQTQVLVVLCGLERIAFPGTYATNHLYQDILQLKTAETIQVLARCRRILPCRFCLRLLRGVT